MRLTSEARSRIKHSDLLPTCSTALELSLSSKSPTDRGSNEVPFPPRTTLSSFSPIASILPLQLEMWEIQGFFFFLHICVYFLLVKPRSVLSADGCLGSPDIPPRGLQSERTERRSLPSFVQFALHLSSYRGSHDITFLPSPLSLCSSSFFFFFFFCGSCSHCSHFFH